MPFIRGRYHINPIAGEALEAAREAEAAMLALQQAGRQNSDENVEEPLSTGNAGEQDGAYDSGQGAAPNAASGPIHRVEIDAAELVPSHSGRAQRGFVARIHRQGIADAAPTTPNSHANSPAGALNALFGARGSAPRNSGSVSAANGIAASPETHVFSDHHDLVNFLRGEFAKDARSRRH